MSKIYLIFRGFACLLIAGCALELCSRLDDALTDGAPLVGPYGYSAMLTFDEFGVVGKPYAHFRKWKLNGQGYRGPDIRWDRERIICIGASETFGFTESEGMEYPRQLERELNKRAGYERYQIVNVAYAGQSIGSFCRRADRVAAAVRPRMALVYPSPANYFQVSLQDSDAVDWVKQSPQFESHLRTKFFDLIDTMPQWAATLRSRIHIWRVTRHTGTMKSVPESNVVRFHQDLSQLLDRLQKDHIQPVLITHATRFGKRLLPEDRPTLIAWRRFTPALEESGFLEFENRFNDVIRSEAAARHIALVDAAQRLSGRGNFADFAHFTDKGASAMANVIADRLLGPDRAQPSPGSYAYSSELKRSPSPVFP